MRTIQTLTRDRLRILITDDPAAATQPACTPELAARLFERWPDAMIVFDQVPERRQRWLYLPDLRPSAGPGAVP
ncbi:MAG: hypothetical protein ACRDZ4_24350 [Egibacteraceae bacterium]